MFAGREIHLGMSPISWGSGEMEGNVEITAPGTQMMSEIALAGFTGCEPGMGFPLQPEKLKFELELRGLQLAGCWFSSFLLTKPYEEVEEALQKRMDFLEHFGTKCINLSEQSYSVQGKLDKSVFEDRHRMDEREWELLCDGLNRLGTCANQRGFRLCYHHHMGTVVQTAEETERMLANTDPEKISLCFDTGHFLLAGADPDQELRKHCSRVGIMHLKGIRREVAESVRREGKSFGRAILEGVFSVPGDGDFDFTETFRILDEGGYEGWLMVEAEQDPRRANPLEQAILTRRYLREKTGL